MRGDAHGDEHDQQIDLDGEVGQEPKLLESTDLTDQEASYGPHDYTNSITESKLARLGQSFAVADKDHGDVE